MISSLSEAEYLATVYLPQSSVSTILCWAPTLRRLLLGLLHQEADNLRELFRQVLARDHDVDDAVIEQVFGALEPLRQFFADRLLDHAGAGEADLGAGLGHVDVAQHGEGGADAAGGRVGEQHDEGQP